MFYFFSEKQALVAIIVQLANGSFEQWKLKYRFPIYSWYFGQCSREEAEAILTKNYNYGNTLMRQKTSDTGQRQYVVSTCDWADGYETPYIMYCLLYKS